MWFLAGGSTSKRVTRGDCDDVPVPTWIPRLTLGDLLALEECLVLRIYPVPVGGFVQREWASLWMSDAGRVARSVPRPLSGTFNLVLVWHARSNVRPIAFLKESKMAGATSMCSSAFSRRVYRLQNPKTSLMALVRALIDFTPRRLRRSAIAIGLHGGAALVMARSRSSSKPRCGNTRSILREKQADSGARIDPRRQTRSSLF